MSLIFYRYVQGNKILYISCRCRLVMVWLRRTTHYLFIVVVAVNSTLLTINTWVAKGAWFALGYPYDFIAVPVWIPSAMLLDLTYWATRRNKHAAILIGGTLIGLSIPLFNMINLLLVRDPLEVAFKYPRPTLPPYMTPIEPQVGKFYNSPVALG